MSVEVQIEEGIREGSKERFKERRGRVEIIADILSAAMEEAKKTEIVYKANLNHKRAGKYIPCLEKRGLMEGNGWGFKTTEKGKEFLRNYQRIKGHLS
jgi:predicted transcriptional regulator